MPKVTINQIDSIMLDAMQRLLNGKDGDEDYPSISVENAKAIQGLAKTIIDSKKLQFQVAKAIHDGDISVMPEIYNEKQIESK